MNILSIALACALFPILSFAQTLSDSKLYKILAEKDRVMFEEGFNQCNLERIAQLLPENFEFYHDKVGLTSTRAAFLNKLHEGACNPKGNPVKRILDEDSVDVFPLYEHGSLYGAIQTGEHRFGGTRAQFMHLWLLKDSKWTLSRIMSYNHKKVVKEVFKNTPLKHLKHSELVRYLGQYHFSKDFVLSITEESEKLYGEAHGEKSLITPIAEHTFLDENKTMKLTFTTNELGVVTELELAGEHGKLLGKRIN